jgi:hypothetical protein
LICKKSQSPVSDEDLFFGEKNHLEPGRKRSPRIPTDHAWSAPFGVLENAHTQRNKYACRHIRMGLERLSSVFIHCVKANNTRGVEDEDF